MSFRQCFSNTCQLSHASASVASDDTFHKVEIARSSDAGGSTFVTGAAVNPTPTIQAIALRIADHIRNERGDLKSR